MHSTQRAKNEEPQPAPPVAGQDAPNKRDLTSWWRQFKRGNPKREDEQKPVESRGIFGVPLQDSIKYANVAISLFDEEGNSYIYGYIPIVVAKCGVFLKEKATEVEGIFRLAGSEKRIKELRETFNSPDRYGKGLDWTGYTVHDAANILRRYFNQLPEPIIPHEHYERFRAPLREYVSTNASDGSTQFVGNFDVDAVIRVYQKLITEIPPLNRQLLLYILDLLAVFAAKSDQNKMTTQNLAAIFQPGILNHPQHDMAPHEYRLSQAVLVFLIENQDHFIVGMQGTAADAQTIQEVQSGGRGSTTPTRSKATGLGRSSSNASAGADSVRRFGGVRRNVSVSSRASRNSVAAASPVTPSFTGNIHRSNTVPSKKSPAIAPGLFKDKSSDTSTPATPPTAEPVNAPQTEPARVPHLAPPEVISPASEDSTPLASAINPASPMPVTTPEKPVSNPAGQQLTPARPGAPADPEAVTTPSATSGVRSFTNMLLRTTSQEPDKKDGRKTNKLQKKRAPGSSNPSAHSSTQSLTGIISEAPASPMPALPSQEPLAPPPMADILKPSMSPSASFRSHSTTTDYSEHDPALHGEDTPTAATAAEQERKRRWRFSKEKDKREAEKAAANQAPHDDLGTIPAAKQSQSSVASSGAPLSPEQTLQPAPSQQESTDREIREGRHHIFLSPNGKDKEKEKEKEKDKDGEKKQNPLGWFKGKIAEHKDKQEKKRAKSPPAPGQQLQSGMEEAASRSSLHLGRPKEEGQRRSGRSMDIPRREKEEGL